MKKIMFNDKYGLTKAVLEGRKTMTRRIVQENEIEDYKVWRDDFINLITGRARYKVGDVVAVAQNYTDVYNAEPTHELQNALMSIIMHYAGTNDLEKIKGFNNKMFVRADLMPHQIRITNVKVERLQDISDEDCLKEGIYVSEDDWRYTYRGADRDFETLQEAFSALIDKISGKGTWKANPWVYAYEFELIK